MPDIPSGMLTKAEVCKRLDVSEKSIERYLKAGKLTPATHAKPPHGGRRMPLFTVEEVERFEKYLRNPPSNPTQATNATTAAVAKVGSDAVGVIATAVARVLSDDASHRHVAVTVSEKLTLTVEEAAAYAGVGVGAIEGAIRDAALAARRIGPHGSNVVRRSDVEQWIHSLWEPTPRRKR